MPFNKSSGAFGDDKDAYETFGRMEEHLKENGVALDGLNYRLGASLRLTPRRNLSRTTRKPTGILPERIARLMLCPRESPEARGGAAAIVSWERATKAHHEPGVARSSSGSGF